MVLFSEILLSNSSPYPFKLPSSTLSLIIFSFKILILLLISSLALVKELISSFILVILLKFLRSISVLDFFSFSSFHSFDNFFNSSCIFPFLISALFFSDILFEIIKFVLSTSTIASSDLFKNSFSFFISSFKHFKKFFFSFISFVKNAF